MDNRLSRIEKCISGIPFVSQIYSLEQRESHTIGKVQIAFDELDSPLDFDVEISNIYPLRVYDTESISFLNRELMPYSHVMGGGNICIHTSHSLVLEEKLLMDFSSLKNWIIKYYINKDTDTHYEHIIVDPQIFDDKYFAYLFTECDHPFAKGEFGKVSLTFFNSGFYKSEQTPIHNFIVQEFHPIYVGPKKTQQWSSHYKSKPVNHEGFYYFVDAAPALYNRFIYENWADLAEYLPTEFLNYLYDFQKINLKNRKGKMVPLFLGYKTVEGEIHWQVAHMKMGEFPLVSVAEKHNNVKTGKWNSELAEEGIAWGISRNVSYKYFFGRGTFCKQITDKRILIIGIGAIGSMVAKTLTKSGCKHIDFADYDVKEPENVCRSEYDFITGITNKTYDLKNVLVNTSPFLETRQVNNNYFQFAIKSINRGGRPVEVVMNDLSDYDIIFDCSTDNDLMHVLDSLNLKADIINLSITNHATALVCAFHPNIYRFVMNQFSNVLKNDIKDLYNPTGCWSPTFKATYNDIGALVQLALKQINKLYGEDKPKNNFVITSDDNDVSLKVIEY